MISQQVRTESETGVPFKTLGQETDRYTGKTVILGGYILEVSTTGMDATIMDIAIMGITTTDIAIMDVTDTGRGFTVPGLIDGWSGGQKIQAGDYTY